MIEMLVVIGIIGILASMLMPALSRAKAKGFQVKCLNNLRQMGIAATLYAADHEDRLPPRRRGTDIWPYKLKPFFLDWKIIACPSDRFGVAGYFASATNLNRSYIINGFNDFFKKNLNPKDYQVYQQWRYAYGMKIADIPNASDTILFGEKKVGSRQVHMDIDQGQHGNDIDEIDHTRHGSGSNFGFADGSVRLVPKGGELYPQNLWSVIEETRYPPAPPAGLK